MNTEGQRRIWDIAGKEMKRAWSGGQCVLVLMFAWAMLDYSHISLFRSHLAFALQTILGTQEFRPPESLESILNP